MLKNILLTMKLTQITFDKLLAEVRFWLQTKYNKANENFSPASIYGQLLSVIVEMYQGVIFYAKRIIASYDLSSDNNTNYNNIRTAAILAGHNPSRAISASGVIKAQIRLNGSIDTEIPGSRIKIKNRTRIKNNINNLIYYVDLGGVEEQIYNITNGTNIFLNVVQGEWKSQVFTGTGEINQSYEASVVNKEIDNFRVLVKHNGEYCETVTHLNDMIPGENMVVVRTAFDGGVTIIFGNESAGFIPEIGSIIEVEYVETDGGAGNIFRRTVNDFRFIDDVLGGDGLPIEFSKLFDIYYQTDINFGAPREDINLMRNLIPMNTNNYILALPLQYAYAIKKTGSFSHVTAFRSNDRIKIIAVPNIKLFKNRNADYFSVNINAFILDSYEKRKLDEYLRLGKYIQMTQRYDIETPVLSFYITNIFLRVFDDVDQENIKTQILDVISEYMLNLKRLDRIPKKDLVNLISAIDGVDSIELKFISKNNEDYHINNAGSISYDSKKIIGIDPVLGDIVFDSNEYPIIRGGWKDRNDIYYGVKPLDSFSTINVYVKGVTTRKNIVK